MNSEIRSYSATNIAELFDAIVYITRVYDIDMWWRGQAQVEWELTPSLHHKGLARYEANMAIRFQNYAAVRHQDVPETTDRVRWLFLMQHYGLPSRLLDWTNAPLTALFFAVREKKHYDRDGVLWGLVAAKLNKFQLNNEVIVGFSSPAIRKLFDDVYVADAAASNDERIVAVASPHFDLRQMAQASEFTIHGSGRPLEQLDNAKEFLFRIVIPKSSKKAFAQTLDLLHIHEASLFPDLEHLARHLASLKYDH